jgi:flagellum-specific peptidoglycan hydrolase FlgJ
MINLRRILEQAKSAKTVKPKKLNVLFVGDADTRAPFSYARDILRTGEVTGEISAANVSIQNFPRLLSTTKNYDVICIMFSNIIPGKTTREEEVLQQMYTTAKETGAKVIAITPTSKDYVAYGHVTHANNEKIVQWVLNQNVSDYAVNAYKTTNKKNFFEKNGLLLNADGHEIIAQQVLQALNGIAPEIDAAAVEREKKIDKEKARKAKGKKGKGKKVTEFKLGSKSPDLIPIQRQLVKLGYEIDSEEVKQGKFGITTAEAVKQFQTINDLSVTSQLTGKDIAAIKSTTAKAYGTLTYMAKSLVNKPEEPAEETPEDADSEETEQDNYAAAASVKKHAAIPKSSQEFFNQWKNVALQHQKDYGIPASITLAQSAIESGFGKSGLTTKYKNFFGITGAYNGKSVKMKNKSGQIFTWRVYPTPEDSFEDHASLLSRRYKPKTSNPTYIDWAKSLTDGGYAESNYGTTLIKFIKQNGLDEYDQTKPEIKQIATGENGKLSASELVSIGNGLKLEPNAAADYLKMEQDANADGVQFNVTDAYRTYEIQDVIFDWDRYNRTGEKKKKGTNTAAALPGTSNHGWGKAIDIFPASAQQWIKKNGYKYNWSWYEGKSINEPWHFTWTTDSSKLKEW